MCVKKSRERLIKFNVQIWNTGESYSFPQVNLREAEENYGLSSGNESSKELETPWFMVLFLSVLEIGLICRANVGKQFSLL